MRIDLGAATSRRVRVAAAATAVVTIVSQLVAPRALAATTPGTIAEVAGGPGTGAAVTIGQNDAALVVSRGNLYIADQGNNAIREIKQGTSTETVVAGNQVSGDTGDGGPATLAEINGPGGVVVDAGGNVLISDTGNGLLRVVAAATATFYGIAMTAKHIYTIAGAGSATGNGIPAIGAALFQPDGLAVDGSGNIVVVDTGRNEVRVIAEASANFYGQAMQAGDIYTIAGNGSVGYSGDHGAATAAQLDRPNAAVLDHHANVVVADTFNQAIRVVATSSGSFYGQPMTAGDIYTVAGTGTPGYAGDGGPATGANLQYPTDVSVDKQGDLAVADSTNHVVRLVAEKTATLYGQAMHRSDIYTVAGDGSSGFSGDGGPAQSAQLNTPQAAVIDTSGNIVIGDEAQSGYAGRVRLVASAAGTYFGQSVPAGDIQTIAGNGLVGSSANGALASNAELTTPQGIMADKDGNVIFSERGDNIVRVVAAKTGTFYGQPMVAKDAYTLAGTGAPGFAGDGGPASAAELFHPQGVGVDQQDDLVIADYDNSRIRFVPATSGTYFGQVMTGGDIYTIAGSAGFGCMGNGAMATTGFLTNPSGAALDASGNLVVSDLGCGVVQVVAKASGTFYGVAMVAGHIYIVAGVLGNGGVVPGDGGPATNANVGVTRVLIDSAHNLVMADAVNYRLRVVPTVSGTYYGQAMVAEHIYTVAGNGTFGNTGDGGLATSAEITPTAVTIDRTGDLVVGDYLSCVVRVVAEATATRYGQAMTIGHIYTIAGTGAFGFSGDGGPGTAAQLAQPYDVAATPKGPVIIADYFNNRLREVFGP